MSLSTASATAASVPGALRTHSSALEAVSDWRGSTWMNVPALPSRKACMRAKPRADCTLETHVSSRSAPNERMTSASSKA